MRVRRPGGGGSAPWVTLDLADATIEDPNGMLAAAPTQDPATGAITVVWDKQGTIRDGYREGWMIGWDTGLVVPDPYAILWDLHSWSGEFDAPSGNGAWLNIGVANAVGAAAQAMVSGPVQIVGPLLRHYIASPNGPFSGSGTQFPNGISRLVGNFISGIDPGNLGANSVLAQGLGTVMGFDQATNLPSTLPQNPGNTTPFVDGATIFAVICGGFNGTGVAQSTWSGVPRILVQQLTTFEDSW